MSISDNNCIYCSTPFGTKVLYKGTLHILVPIKEHFQPKRDRGKNRCQTVKACQICNMIKFNHVFETGTDAQNFILDQLLSSDWRAFE